MPSFRQPTSTLVCMFFFIRLRRYDAMISGPPIITRREPYLNPISGLPRALHSFMLRLVTDSCELRRCRRVVVCCFIINMATLQLVLDLDPSFVHCELSLNGHPPSLGAYEAVGESKKRHFHIAHLRLDQSIVPVFVRICLETRFETI